MRDSQKTSVGRQCSRNVLNVFRLRVPGPSYLIGYRPDIFEYQEFFKRHSGPRCDLKMADSNLFQSPRLLSSWHQQPITCGLPNKQSQNSLVRLGTELRRSLLLRNPLATCRLGQLRYPFTNFSNIFEANLAALTDV